MKSLLLTTLEYPPQLGGIAGYLGNIVEHLPADKVNVLASDAFHAHESDMSSDTPVYRRRLISRWLRPRWLPALFWTDWLCRKERPSLILVSHLLPMGRIARIMKRRKGIPYVVIVHGMDVALASSGGMRKKRLAGRILQDASFVVANSGFTANFVESFGIPKKDILIVRPSPGFPLDTEVRPEDAGSIRARYRLGGDFTLLSVGRLVKRKGFDDCIKAVSMLRDRGVFVQYLVVGDGQERERLEELAADMGVEGRVIFAGSVPKEGLPAIYAACDIFVTVPKALGPDIEGFGIVFLEAGLLGKPVIGSRSGGVPDAVLHGETGLLIEPGNVQELVSAVLKIKDDPELASRLGEKGRERVLNEFGWARQTRRFVAALKDME